MRQPYGLWYQMRWAVLVRDQFTCQYCGQFAPNVRLEVDHKIAVVDGGTDALDNLVTACYSCNRGKEAYRARVRGGTSRSKSGVDSITQRLTQLLKTKPDIPLGEAAAELNAREETIRVLMYRVRRKLMAGKPSPS